MTDLAATDREVIDRAQHHAEKIVAGCKAIRTAWVMLGGYLHEFIEDRMWEPLGFDGLREWLASPEIGLGYKPAMQAARVYRELVVERKVSPGELQELEVTKLDVVLPKLKAGEVSWDEARADVVSLAKHDLEVRYQQRDVNGKLDPGSEPQRQQCPTCGAWRDAT